MWYKLKVEWKKVLEKRHVVGLYLAVEVRMVVRAQTPSVEESSLKSSDSSFDGEGCLDPAKGTWL